MLMEVVKVRALAARLSRRKQQIAVTLNHLKLERFEVEKNTEWKDAVARQRRRNLLNYLNGWYVREMNEVDRALQRVSKNKYGTCACCNCVIEETDWLETFPEAELCRSCQGIRDRTERI
jgi:RNA polymerase-binding transcription factor DksA